MPKLGTGMCDILMDAGLWFYEYLYKFNKNLIKIYICIIYNIKFI
jgi:hypothetical protein